MLPCSFRLIWKYFQIINLNGKTIIRYYVLTVHFCFQDTFFSLDYSCCLSGLYFLIVLLPWAQDYSEISKDGWMRVWCSRVTEKLKGKVKVMCSVGRGKAIISSSVTQPPALGSHRVAHSLTPHARTSSRNTDPTRGTPPRLVKGWAVLFPIKLSDLHFSFTLSKAINKADQLKYANIFCVKEEDWEGSTKM